MDLNPYSKFYLSAHIRQKRESLNLSPSFIAESLDLNLAQYLEVENGEADFSLDSLEKLSALLNLKDEDINDLLQFASISQANALALEFSEEDDDEH